MESLLECCDGSVWAQSFCDRNQLVRAVTRKNGAGRCQEDLDIQP
jgi:hypothetical protein